MRKALWQHLGIQINSMKIFNFRLRQTKTRLGSPPQPFEKGRCTSAKEQTYIETKRT